MNKYDYSYSTQSSPPVLMPGEQVLWQGKPKKNAFIINKVLTMLPIALIWLVFDGFIFGQVFAGGGGMMGIMIPFALLHLMPVWIWLGNVITANQRWKNTMYYMTGRRILIQTGFAAQELQTIYYKDIRHVSLHIGLLDKFLGVGDIYFDLGEYYSKSKTRAIEKAFLDLEAPHQIYTRIQKIVLDIQTDTEFPNAYRPEDNPGYNTQYKG